MSTTRPPPSTIKHPTQQQQLSQHPTILKRSQSITSESDDDVYVPPPESAASTSSALLSPSLSLSSSSTLHYKASTMTDQHSRSSSFTTSRHFYSSAMGRPPGSQQHQTKRKTTPTPTPSSSFPIASSPSKTIPMKELQKILADLKKENFDLKLRLYYLEQQAEKNIDKSWLMDENQRLQLDLDDRTIQMEKLEHTVSTLLSIQHQQQQQQRKSSCDASTQVDLLPTSNRSNQASAIDTSSESRSHVAQSSPFSAPVLPTFPADPASFGLPPSSALSAPATTATKKTARVSSSTSYNNSNVDVATMVYRFQNVRLASPKTNRRSSSSAPKLLTEDHDHGLVTGWLDRIPIPSFMSSSSTPSTPSSSPYTPSTQSQ